MSIFSLTLLWHKHMLFVRTTVKFFTCSRGVRWIRHKNEAVYIMVRSCDAAFLWSKQNWNRESFSLYLGFPYPSPFHPHPYPNLRDTSNIQYFSVRVRKMSLVRGLRFSRLWSFKSRSFGLWGREWCGRIPTFQRSRRLRHETFPFILRLNEW
jgi:hypothetical protein